MSRALENTFLNKKAPALRIHIIDEYDLAETSVLDKFFATRDAVGVGVAASYYDYRIQILALATLKQVLLVDLSGYEGEQVAASRQLLTRWLTEENILFMGFNLARLFLALFADTQMRISNAFDFESLERENFEDKRDHLFQSVEKKFDGDLRSRSKYKQLIKIFQSEDYEQDKEYEAVAVRAWLAIYAGNKFDVDKLAPVMNIDNLSTEVLGVLSHIFRTSDRLEALKPLETPNIWIKPKDDIKVDGCDVEIEAIAYKNRFRKDQKLRFEMEDDKAIEGTVKLISNKTAHVVLEETEDELDVNKITAVVTVGREPRTNSEQKKRRLILDVLRGTAGLESKLFEGLWLPTTDRPCLSLMNSAPTRRDETASLNRSQRFAVESMITDGSTEMPRVVVVRGPPGTGKTSCIAAFTKCHLAAERGGLWLVAQSNVAVKNIAEKLIKEKCENWKLLVAPEFEHWHFHLYEKNKSADQTQSYVLVSSEIPWKKPDEVDKIFEGTKVILSTVSMLAALRPQLVNLVPVETLIVDEASQIPLGDYLYAFHTFASTLRRVCFIGDDKQLPPYGQDDLGDLQSIFEVQHLQEYILLLDIQYRMPALIGDFISRKVYDGKLRSYHNNHSISACQFVEVNGRETRRGSTSWSNMREADAVILIVKALVQNNKKFRVVTPYDAQRGLIEHKLRSEGLPWKDKCFNVDSFQGNEEEYIILSIVRSFSPGFLASQRRTNVMLSRCKAGMFILTSKEFVENSARKTLVGEMALEWSEPWIKAGEIWRGDATFQEPGVRKKKKNEEDE